MRDTTAPAPSTHSPREVPEHRRRAGAEREAQLDPSHYLSDDYFTRESLHSLSFQVQQLRSFGRRRILEVGVGNGFVSTFLRRAGFDVVTADINPALGADVCRPLRELPKALSGERFDLVSCCEVLEHMPFEELPANLAALRELAPNAFISLPGHFPWLGFAGRLGVHNRFVDVALGVRIPVRRRLSEGHCWELGSRWATRRGALVGHMKKQFGTVESGVFPMHRYHYFFRCRDTDA
jgi:SAM-dependent methyltransferase